MNTLYIDYGYTVHTKDLTVDSIAARRIMKSKNRLKFSRVERSGEQFVFRTEMITCPICHATYDARELFPSEPIIYSPYEIDCFIDPRKSLYQEQPEGSLQINTAIFKDKPSVVCPFCMNTIYKTNAKRNIRLSKDSEKVCVSMEIKSVRELLDCLFTVSDSVTVDICHDVLHASREVFTLHHDGRTYLSFENGTDETYQKDITEDFNAEKLDICLSVISHNNDIKRYLIDFLKPSWHTDFPFTPQELTITDLIALNRFRGFNRDFYRSVPYRLGSLQTEGSFPVFADIGEALTAYQNSTLPKTKTIKKCLFEKQGLLFYLPELACLFDDINPPRKHPDGKKEEKNISLFCDMLAIPEIHTLLYYLHTYPVVHQFIRDYCQTGEQIRKFIHLLQISVSHTCEMAKDYGGLSEYYKREKSKKHFREYSERIESIGTDFFHVRCPIHAPYSMPMVIPESILSLEDSVLDCDFRFLRTTNETRHAGNALHNCLRNWSCGDENVLVIKRGTAIVAAVQLSFRHTRVEQAKLAYNESIEENEKVRCAFFAWCEKHNLIYPDYYDFPDEEEDDDDEIA